jgi:hypothetical protein
MIDSNQDNDVNTNEQDNFSSSHSTFNKQQKVDWNKIFHTLSFDYK